MNANRARFAVVVRFDSHATSPPTRDVKPPLTYWHNAPLATAKRLAALINRRAQWAKGAEGGSRFYIVDHGKPDARIYQRCSLSEFRTAHGLPHAKPGRYTADD